ncbi:MAG: RICIN domain-containing protein [Cryobacterium sp.]|nr:RICIN domain-containing protein [Cryobacterium sp.]
MGAHRKTEPRRPSFRSARHGIIAGVAVFLLLIGGTASYAAWTTGATASSTASAATLGISTSGFNSNAFTFQNHLLKTTGSVTLTNNTVTSSSTPGTFTMSLGYTGDAALAAKLAVTIWSTTNTGGCAAVGTPPSGAISGYWDTVATTGSPITGTLAKNATASYCIRVSAAERGDLAATAGALTIQPSISASLTVGNWSQSASATATQKTAWIFPAFGPTPNTWYQIVNQGTLNCLDVYGANSASGTGAIDYACKPGNATGDYNQEWKFTRSSGNYYDMTPRHAQAVRLDVAGSSTAALAAVDLETDNGSRVSQEWQLQKQAGSFYQIVNRNSGLCLQPNNTSVYNPEVEYAQAVCDGSANQRYSLTTKDVDVPAMTLSCASAAGGGVTYSWSGAAIDTYNFQAKPSAGSTWAGVGDATAGASSITILPSALTGADGKYDVRAMWLSNQLATSGLWRSTTSGVTSLSCSAPATLQCTNTGSGSNQTVIYSFTPSAPQSYKLQVRTNATTWADMNNGTFYTGSATISGNPPFNLSDGTYPVQAVNSSGSVLGTSQVVVATGGVWIFQYTYVKCQ